MENANLKSNTIPEEDISNSCLASIEVTVHGMRHDSGPVSKVASIAETHETPQMTQSHMLQTKAKKTHDGRMHRLA